jgi:hypothetical protein
VLVLLRLLALPRLSRWRPRAARLRPVVLALLSGWCRRCRQSPLGRRPQVLLRLLARWLRCPRPRPVLLLALLLLLLDLPRRSCWLLPALVLLAVLWPLARPGLSLPVRQLLQRAAMPSVLVLLRLQVHLLQRARPLWLAPRMVWRSARRPCWACWRRCARPVLALKLQARRRRS